jgi:hypothetical protein
MQCDHKPTMRRKRLDLSRLPGLLNRLTNGLAA